MPRRHLRHLTIFLLLLALMGLSGFGAHRIAQRLGLSELQATGLHRLDLYTASLEREIGKYAFLPGTLGLERDVLDLLRHPAGNKLTPQVNAYLEQLNERAGTLSIYVIDTAGHVVATSNWRRADSFLGEDLSFRPYSATPSTAAAGVSSASVRRAASPAITWPPPWSTTARRWASPSSRSVWSN